MEGKTTNLELVDPSPPESMIPDPALSAWWIAAALIVLLAVAALRWSVVRRRSRSASPTAIRDAAFKEASDALAEITSPDARSGAIQCSLILRHYLAKACGDPALFETHEEFVSRHDSLGDLTETTRAAVQSEFDHLVHLKYSSKTPQVPAGEVTAGCRRLLETLHRGFRS